MPQAALRLAVGSWGLGLDMPDLKHVFYVFWLVFVALSFPLLSCTCPFHVRWRVHVIFVTLIMHVYSEVRLLIPAQACVALVS